VLIKMNVVISRNFKPKEVGQIPKVFDAKCAMKEISYALDFLDIVTRKSDVHDVDEKISDIITIMFQEKKMVSG